jgi:hypothetical protein
MKSTYLTVAETAKLVRAALKKSFPGVKCSIRSKSYSGDASISVDWTNGPAAILVNKITQSYASARFDGSIDMGYSVTHWLLEDGSATVASSSGTQDSKGSHSPYREWMPEPGAKLVHFGAGYIHTRRKLTPALATRAVASLARRGYEASVSVWTDGTATVRFNGQWHEEGKVQTFVQNFMIAGGA